MTAVEPGAGRKSRRLLLTSLLDAPALCGAVVAAGAVHVALTGAGFAGWTCPFFQATGWPCPGCGLGRASVLLLRGEWLPALRLHAFAPFLLLTLLVLGAGFILRGRAREAWRRAVRRVEERTPIVPVLLVLLLVYWALRFVLDAAGWRALVS
jgi:hypothetical protein